jgi:hypothetical protein
VVGFGWLPQVGRRRMNLAPSGCSLGRRGGGHQPHLDSSELGTGSEVRTESSNEGPMGGGRWARFDDEFLGAHQA